ncbi:MAG: methylmalonyl Co-A mutase-associated GTPase MeaB [Nitrospiraceae bacterium]|nr:MAG: methylmalonyl Co-A mutase-associated GTPase MeaB [Nitrospiraceae bacterium]
MKSEHILKELRDRNPRGIARAISLVEDNDPLADEILASLDDGLVEQATVLGITGPPGAGKSTLTDRIISKYRSQGKRVGVIAVDPSSPLSGGAILGDRIRMMGHALDQDVVVRSMATRGRLGGLCAAAGAAVRILAGSGCTVIIIETVGVGQSEMDIIRLADITALVLAPGLGDDIQAMKAGLLEVADLMIVNKADCEGAETLAMDLESIAREGGKEKERAKICMTVASEGKGIDDLLAAIDAFDASHRESGERRARRERAYDLEVLDWAIEMIKPSIIERIKKGRPDRKGDPRLQAAKLLEGNER